MLVKIGGAPNPSILVEWLSDLLVYALESGGWLPLSRRYMPACGVDASDG